jgi:lysozyme family protein
VAFPLPLIALATTLVPELLRLVAGDRAGTVAHSVAGVVKEVTGTDDLAAARQKLEADAAAREDLRLRLTRIALEAEARRRDQELEAMWLGNANVGDARRTMLELARQGGVQSYGAVVVSIVVTVGFFGSVIILIALGDSLKPNESGGALLNITVGALVAAFTAVVNFWIGSSQGSREKDQAVRQLQAAQVATQAEAVTRLKSEQTEQLRIVEAMSERAAARVVRPAEGPSLNLDAFRAVAPAAGRDEAFNRCVEVVLGHEGGFSDHPKDPGGATNFGITHKTLAEFRDVDSVTKEDVRNLTRDEAKEIYRARYWLPLRCNDPPPGVDLMVFDFGVNAGVGRAARTLQACAHVTTDGSIGPITMAAVRAIDPKRLIVDMAEARERFYRGLPDFDTFGRGWLRRLDETRVAALRMATERAPAAMAAA